MREEDLKFPAMNLISLIADSTAVSNSYTYFYL